MYKYRRRKTRHLKGQLACNSKTSAIRYKNALDKIGKFTSIVAMSTLDTREGHQVISEDSKGISQKLIIEEF